jgi:hypothetical protein
MFEFTIKTTKNIPKFSHFQGPEEWIDLPEHIWIKIFNNLCSSCILPAHEVCRKFHELANLYPRHELHLGKLLISEENIEYFKKSSRIYKKVEIYEFEGLTEVKFNQTIDLLKPTSLFVKELILGHVTIEKMWLTRILKQLSNLDTLNLLRLQSNDPDQETQQSIQISLPKLQNITICDCEDAFERFLVDLRDCSVVDLYFLLTGHFTTNSNNNYLTSFIKNQEKSLKKLSIWNSLIRPADWNFIGDLKEIRLESLNLTRCRDDNNLLQNFLRQNAATLKFLSLTSCGLTDQLLETICESLKNLETLCLANDSFANINSGLLALQKLTKLKTFNVHFLSADKNVLEGFTFVVNENLVEIEATIDGASPEFIEKFADCVPNLAKFRMGFDSTCILREVLKHCKNLRELNIINRRLVGLSRREDESFMQEIYDLSGEILDCVNDYGDNLIEVSLFTSDDLDEGFVREKLKNQIGLKIRWKGVQPIVI